MFGFSTRPVTPRPSPAEVARTVLANATGVQLRSGTDSLEVHRHAMTRHGVLLLLVPDPDRPASAWWHDEAQPARTVRLVATEVAPLPMADRVRGTAVLTGRLGPLATPLAPEVESWLRGPVEAGEVLRLVPRQIAVGGRLVGSEAMLAVDPAAYLAAEPDPLLAHETEWLEHLVGDHADVLHALANLTGARGPARPVALDSYGLVLHAGGADHRFAFDQPVRCACDLGPAFTALLERELPDVVDRQA